MSYLRMYPGPKMEKETRRQLRQEQEKGSVIQLPVSPKIQEQKESRLELGMNYLVILAVIGVSLVLVSLEIYMGWNIAKEQASDPNNQIIFGWFNVASATFTFLLPYLATRIKPVWLVWAIIFFPYSLYNTYSWIHQNWSDVVVAKQERKTDEIITLEDRYKTVKQQAYDECHTGKNGSQRGPLCKDKEDESKELYTKLEAKQRDNKQEAKADPRNTAIVKLLSFFHQEVSIGTVKTVVAILVSFIPPCGGLVFKFAIRCLRRR